MERIKLVKPMTNNVAIRVENLSKRYRIGQYVGSGSQYRTLRESLTNAVSAPLRHLRSVFSSPRLSTLDSRPSTDNYIWALKDVSFEVKRGEVLGIIGRNGAGKSTLLKILTRITEPTEGWAELRGRVGSLLEVGTGFHPELTGRENVYLSGAVLGMTRKEIDRKFDEIVEFSGIEKFIDTPIKRYSSGMSVRLGFAVAAHLEPEILLVDEVLSVGDARFRKKCQEKIRDITALGRTILFVSHNMPAVKMLCSRAVLFDGGRVVQDGYVETVVTNYLSDEKLAVSNGVISENVARRGTGEALLQRVVLIDFCGNVTSKVFLGQKLRVLMSYDVKIPVENAIVEVGVSTVEGLRILTVTSIDGDAKRRFRMESGFYKISVEIEAQLLPGEYLIDVFLHQELLSVDNVRGALRFRVINQSESGGDQWIWTDGFGTVRGFVRAKSKWSGPVQERYG